MYNVTKFKCVLTQHLFANDLFAAKIILLKFYSELQRVPLMAKRNRMEVVLAQFPSRYRVDRISNSLGLHRNHLFGTLVARNKEHGCNASASRLRMPGHGARCALLAALLSGNATWECNNRNNTTLYKFHLTFIFCYSIFNNVITVNISLIHV